MTRARVFWQRVRGLFRPRSMERELDDELQFHLQMEIDDLVRKGMEPGAARFAALRRFGGLAQAKETYREVHALPAIEILFQDLRYGLRLLQRNAGFAAVAILSLALGTGANSAIFTLIRALILRPLPVARPEELVQLRQETPKGPLSKWTYDSFRFFEERTELFSGVLGQSSTRFNLEIGGQAESVVGVYVSGGYFPVLGVPPLIGRYVTPTDDQETGGPDGPVAVISYAFWISRFAGDPAVVGRTIAVQDTPLRIAGVMPASFFGVAVGETPAIFIPLRLEPMLQKSQSNLHGRYAWWIDVLARKKEGLTDAGLRSGLDTFWPRMLEGVFPVERNRSNAAFQGETRVGAVNARNGISELRRQFSAPLFILMGIAGVVLLIACANVANLLMARTTARQREVGVRLAVGASRSRLMRQLLTESLLLSGLGSLAGILFAFWGCRLLLSLLSIGRRAVLLDVHPDPAILGFTAAVAVITGILFGAGPALRATSWRVADGLKQHSQAVTGRSVGNVLVVVQVAMCLMLLIGAGLFVRTFWNITNQRLGYDPRNIYVASIDPQSAGYRDERLSRFYIELAEALNRHAGVESASLSINTPIAGCCWTQRFTAEGQPQAAGDQPTAILNNVSPGFFRTFGTRLRHGRDFNERDGRGTPLVAIVSQSVASQFFPGTSPVGRHISLRRDELHQNVEIVGVVEDMRTRGLRAYNEYEIYFDMFQAAGARYTVEIRTSGGVAQAAAIMRELVHGKDPRIRVTVDSFNEQIARTALSERMSAIVAALFGMLALVLACIGLYGVISYNVVRRTSELGIRMALGAPAPRITRMILRESVLLAAFGALIGIPLALACARLMTSLSTLLFGLRADDPPTIAAMVILLIAMAAVSGYIPARKAAGLDPVKALRSE